MGQKTKFKQTEIGEIPEYWEIKLLNEVVEKIIDYRGKTPKKSKTGIITISAKSIKKGKIDYSQTYFISEKTFEEWEKRGKPQIGDVIITSEGPLGEIAQYDKRNVALAQRLITLRGKKEILDNLFLKYYLMSSIGQHQLNLRATGTTVQGIKQSELRKILILLPSLLEQKSIASILSSLDTKIELNNKTNQILEAIGHVLFKRWFVDERKEEWKEGRLGDYVESISGCSYTSKGLNSSENALVTLKSVGVNGFKQDGFKEYTGEYNENHLVQEGDIVVAHTDLTQDRIILGKPVIVRDFGKYKKMIASMDLSIVKPVKLINKPYLFYLLNSISFHGHAQGYSNGTTVIHLSRKAIPEFSFIIPDKEILEKFKIIANKLFNQIRINDLQNQKLSQIRDALLPKLMSGEIRVK